MKFFIFIILSLTLNSCALKKIAAPTIVDNRCFKWIANFKNKEFKENMIECKSYRNFVGLTPLMMAVLKDNNDIAEYLIGEKVDVNETEKSGYTALNFAAIRNNARLVQVLRRNGARIEIIGDNLSPLMLAVRNASPQLVQVMQPNPTEVNLRAEDGWTAIYFAIRREDSEILKFLLDQGACVNTVDSYKQTPLDFAKEVKWKVGQKLLRRKTAC